MKRIILLCTLILVCCINIGCKADETVKTNDYTLENNNKIIANTLGIEETNRNLKFIMNSLNTINAGQIQSAELHETNKEKVLDIIAEDNTKYQIYLSDSNKVEAIKNIDTDEWVIKSER